MPLKERILNVKLEMASGTVVLDSSINMHVNIQKPALAVQQTGTIDVVNLTTSLREQLLSQFTAWNKRKIQSGQADASHSYVNVTIEAGYADDQAKLPTPIFVGQVAAVTPTSPPPNIGVRIDCFTRQVDRTKFTTSQAPVNTTFYEYVKWAAGQMELPFECETSFNDKQLTNPSGSTHIVAHLLLDIQSFYRPDVVAFIDNGKLIVKNKDGFIKTSDIVQVNEFIGIPQWTEWGVEFQTLFDPKIQLAGACTLNSRMNPSLNKTFVTTQVQYDLATRDNPFYVKVSGSPPA